MLIFFIIWIPIILGLLLPILKLNRLNRKIYVIGSTVLTSFLVYYLTFIHTGLVWTLVKISNMFSISFGVDGLSKIFLILIATLWPLATIYATQYMDRQYLENLLKRLLFSPYHLNI